MTNDQPLVDPATAQLSALSMLVQGLMKAYQELVVAVSDWVPVEARDEFAREVGAVAAEAQDAYVEVMVAPRL